MTPDTLLLVGCAMIAGGVIRQVFAGKPLRELLFAQPVSHLGFAALFLGLAVYGLTEANYLRVLIGGVIGVLELTIALAGFLRSRSQSATSPPDPPVSGS